MNYLLDTHTFLWFRSAPDRLSDKVRAICADDASALSLSVASTWELAIKLSIGKLKLNQPLKEVIADAEVNRGISVRSIELADSIRVEHLPFHHRDPFDRLLASQALNDGLVLLSKDVVFDAYGVTRVW